MKRKIIFIAPAKNKQITGFQYLNSGKVALFNLAILASLVPDYWEIKIVDENIDTISPEPADILAITAMGIYINRAKQIAQMYKGKYPQIKIVVGGVHASALPEEVNCWADSIVIGEAENIFSDLIADFEKGRLQKIYKGEPPNLTDYDHPVRLDLLNLSKYIVWPIHTTRGCQFGCDFCSVWRHFGRIPRHYNPDFIKKQIQFYKDKQKLLNPLIYFFVDDNIFANPVFIKKVMLLLAKYHIRWMAQVSLPMCFDLEAFRLAENSGCELLFIGFESIDQMNLQSVHKKYSVADYKKAVANCHAVGIGVYGGFILGFDYDRPGVGTKTARFALELKLELAQVSFLTPFPGTELFDRIKDKLIPQERKNIKAGDWSHFDATYPVWQHPILTKEQWIKEHEDFYKVFFGLKHLGQMIRSFSFRQFNKSLFLTAANLDFWQASFRLAKARRQLV